jgi:hypothetical protein
VLSGDVRARVSGDVVVAKVSGEVMHIRVPTIGRTRALLVVTGASGGATLASGDVISVALKALSTNSGDIYVGSATDMPYSGFGFLLGRGEGLNIDIDNFNRIRVFATVSGDQVTYFGVQL